MRKIRLLLAALVASICSVHSAWAQDEVVASVTLKEKNSLATEILALSGIDDVKTVTSLTVATNAGVQMGDEDWTTLKSMVALVNLDLSQASATAVPDNQFSLHGNLTTVKLPQGLTSIGGNAFTRCTKLVTVEVPGTVNTIGECAFMSCHILENCDLSACQLVTIPNSCFNGCEKLSSFTIPSTVTSIGYSAFRYCESFTSPLPVGLTSIEQDAFEGAAMENVDVVIPEWGYIGQWAFSGTRIRSIELPSTCYDHPNCFDSCPNLQTITLKSPTLVSGISAVSNAADITLRVPSHLVAAYKSHPQWSKYKDAVAITPAVTDYVVNADLNLSSSAMRMAGTPSLYFNNYQYNFFIAGNAPQTFKDITVGANLASYFNANMVINESADVTVTGDYKQRVNLWGNKWHFLTMPFDFLVGDVTVEKGDFAIRTYNGTRRNIENATSGNWSANLPADAEIKAGTGFIVQTSDYTWLNFKAKSGGTNYVFSKESDELVLPLAANNGNAEASAANTGWNMVGNPWQAYYNIHKMNYTAPFAVYNNGQWRYDTYSPADDDYALQPFQAIFVQCPNGIESIGFPANGRQLTSEVTSQNAARAMSNGSRQLFDLEVSDGTLSDKTRLVLNAAATADYEIGRDANKFFVDGSATPQIYTLDADGTQYAINERPAADGQVNIGIRFGQDGDYTLSAQRNNIGQVLLTDHETGIITDLSEHAYAFSADEGLCEGRFTLRLGAAVTGISTLNANHEGGTEVYTLDGTKAGATTDGLQKGVYVVRHGQRTQKVIVK